MSNHCITVDFFGSGVRCETDGMLVSLTDMVSSGNKYRMLEGLPPKRLQDITGTDGFKNFVAAVTKNTRLPTENVVVVRGRGRTARTMAHYIVAIYVAEQMSPDFHYSVIETFVGGKLLEFRALGGTEFAQLNGAIDMYLPGRDGKDNKGVYIQVAKRIRARILGADVESGAWNSASVDQTRQRYEVEKKLCDFLRVGLVRDFDHLKELIDKV